MLLTPPLARAAHLDVDHAAVGGVLARLLLIVEYLRWRRVLRPLPFAHGCCRRMLLLLVVVVVML
jgi:hypothetical protein